MALSVGDLLDTPHLRLALQAGREGSGNRVTWAQTSDLDRPWEWMTGGELLMKNGRTLPPTPAGQIALLEGLVEHGISGLVLGIDPETPPLDPAAAATANSLALPVIFAPYSVGFAAIGRAVADATTADEGRRMAVTERVYTMIRRSVTQRRGTGRSRNSPATSRASSPSSTQRPGARFSMTPMRYRTGSETRC